MRTELNVEFGGFYASIHSNKVDELTGSYYEYEEDLEEDIDYSSLYLDYCVSYAEKFTRYLGEFIKVPLEFAGLNSPKEYNFTTDKLKILVDSSKLQEIIDFGLINYEDEMIELCKSITTPRDGYIPFYTYNEVWCDDKFKAELALEVVILNGDDDFLNRWFDSSECNELIF